MHPQIVSPITLIARGAIGLIAFLFTTIANAQPTNCDPQPDTITIALPKVGLPPDEEGQGWVRPQVWQHHADATDDSITIPNGRPIYALIISGYASNRFLDELMVYKFARHLMAQGAYVHYAWWNNLLAPYMERPLHHMQSHPGNLTTNGFNFTTAKAAGKKAVPAEDYQLVADAKLMLSAIREHNPSAIIIVVGHSMGGGATVHIGSRADVLIDILAPIDPVGNRNYPWSGFAPEAEDFNWTRWRVSRNHFLGYRSSEFEGGIFDGECVPVGPWLKNVNEIDNDFLCSGLVNYHNAPRIVFGSNIINLHHRYQKEALFPFDFEETEHFGHSEPANGTTSQSGVAMKPAFISFGVRYPDPGGWPAGTSHQSECCFAGDGVGWNKDGHGEIVGYRGPLPNPVPIGVRVQTSPRCGNNCDNLIWPARSVSFGTWSNGDSALRVQLLQALEILPSSSIWGHEPTNPDLCRVSNGLINKFNVINKPPTADGGDDQFVECSGVETPVMLIGLNSTDPDGDELDHTWTWATGEAFGPVAVANLPMGTHCITLEVRDPSGHIDQDAFLITVEAGGDDDSSDDDDSSYDDGSSDDDDSSGGEGGCGDDDSSDDDDSSHEGDGCSDDGSGESDDD